MTQNTDEQKSLGFIVELMIIVFILGVLVASIIYHITPTNPIKDQQIIKSIEKINKNSNL